MESSQHATQKTKTKVATSKRWLSEEPNDDFYPGNASTQRPSSSLTCSESQTATNNDSTSWPETPVEILANFAEGLPRVLNELPVDIGLDRVTASDVVTGRVRTILNYHGHDLGRLTAKSVDIVDSALCFAMADSFSRIFESQVCSSCYSSGQIHVTRTCEVKAGMTKFELQCRNCKWESSHLTDSRVIEYQFHTKSWMPNFILSFFLNGQYFKDYEHVLDTLGVSHLSHRQWLRIIDWLHPEIKQLANWSCQEVLNEAARRGDRNNLRIQYDGFYLTRGYHANNSSGTIHDQVTGKVIAFRHRTKRGQGGKLGWNIWWS